MKKIWIDEGHGGNDPGATANGLQEKDIVLTIGNHLTKIIRDNYEADVLRTRTDDTFTKLSDRAKKANEAGADLFVSIHINAGGGTGFETFIHPLAPDATQKIQKKIHAAILQSMKKDAPTRNRGLKRAKFVVLRQTAMPAVLTENLFVDHHKDAQRLHSESFLKNIAEGHARGIAEALNLKKKKQSTLAPQIAMIQVNVKDLDKAIAWYEKVLCLQVSSNNNHYPVAVDLVHDGCRLLLHKTEQHTRINYPKVSQTLICFRVDNLASEMQRLQELDVEFLHNSPQNFPAGLFAAFRDPFGNVHELVEYC
jgi:N-acetylmuramoyl-L-alanine amidase